VRDCFRKDAVSIGIRYRDAKDIQVFPCIPTADAKNGACAIESRSIPLIVAWPVARMPDWQARRQRNPLKSR
jgi:hypothetical protein